MASLPQPMPYYSYYPPPSDPVHHAGKPTPDEGRGSFGPVLVVLAVITFLATAACVAGRLCGRSRSRRSSSSASSSTAENGKHPAVAMAMRPLPSSRATVHDDVFEIKLEQVNPAGIMGRERDGGGSSREQALPPPPPQLGQLPPQYAAQGFRCAPAPANGGGVARPAQVRGAPAGGGSAYTPSANKSQISR